MEVNDFITYGELYKKDHVFAKKRVLVVYEKSTARLFWPERKLIKKIVARYNKDFENVFFENKSSVE